MIKKILVIALASMVLSNGLNSLSSANVQENADSPESIDMLIFLSPQYANNLLINWAINRYIDAVKEDIDWNAKIIKITSDMNDFRKIDQIIEGYYKNYTIKACIMVGEDIDTALYCDWHYNEAPSTIPWETIGGESRYYFDEQNGCKSGKSGNYTFEICVSLIYPTHFSSNFKKSLQIAKVFLKFSRNRKIVYTGDILAFVGSTVRDDPVGQKAREIYQSLDQYGDLYYSENPSPYEIKASLFRKYSIYGIHGHSNPGHTAVNYTLNPRGFTKNCTHDFHARYLNYLNTPFFMAGGCYVDGWFSFFKDNNRLDPSINRIWYGSRIFTSRHIRVMVLGFPGQTAGSISPGGPYKNFIVNALPDLITGKTLAESMIGKTYYYSGDQTVYGDPTFHFS